MTKIFVRVKPKAKIEKVEKINENSFLVWVKEPAKKGKANQAVLRVLADYFEIPISQIKLLKGAKERNKIFKINLILLK